MKSFKSLGLSEQIIKAVIKLGFKTPTEVQKKVIPKLLKKNTDLVALAQTGTGKTAAFGFPPRRTPGPSQSPSKSGWG